MIYCCGCEKHIIGRLVGGDKIYPHRPDLSEKWFWICDKCKNYVGTHNDEQNRPLGSIPTPAIRKVRNEIHAILDPLWKSGKHKRGYLYAKLTKAIGKEYHTASVNSVEEAEKVKAAILQIEKDK